MLARGAGRAVDVVPERQLAAALDKAFIAANELPQRVVVAQADRASPALADQLRTAGHAVEVHVAYRTTVRHPSDEELALLDGVDAVVFASGSAVVSWAEALGDDAARRLPPIVVAIGPSTAARAADFGLKNPRVAADHSLAGVVDELVAAWTSRPRA